MKFFVSVLGLAVIVGMGAAACSSSTSSSGGGVSCSSKSKCPNDAPATQADIDSCNKLVSDPNCGSAGQTLINCSFANQTCDANGKTTSNTACQSQSDAYGQCLVAHLDAGGGGG